MTNINDVYANMVAHEKQKLLDIQTEAEEFIKKLESLVEDTVEAPTVAGGYITRMKAMVHSIFRVELPQILDKYQ